MINITFPDGAVRQYEKELLHWTLQNQFQKDWQEKLLAASVNGQVWDASRPINEDATLKLLTWDDTDGKNTFWHSSAHLMAEAVESYVSRRKILGWAAC